MLHLVTEFRKNVDLISKRLLMLQSASDWPMSESDSKQRRSWLMHVLIGSENNVIVMPSSRGELSCLQLAHQLCLIGHQSISSCVDIRSGVCTHLTPQKGCRRSWRTRDARPSRLPRLNRCWFCNSDDRSFLTCGLERALTQHTNEPQTGRRRSSCTSSSG
jgi:hypothetical protein